MKRLTQSGSHLVIGMVGLLVVGVIAFAGYTVMQRQNTTDTATTTPATSPATGSIKTTADLNATASQLDSSSSQLDSSLNDAQLDADLNDML